MSTQCDKNPVYIETIICMKNELVENPFGKYSEFPKFEITKTKQMSQILAMIDNISSRLYYSYPKM